MTAFEEEVLALARLLVRLDPRRGEKFLPRLMRQLSELFKTDRVSLLLLDLRSRRFSRGVCSGFKIPHNDFNESNLAGLRVLETGKPLITNDVKNDYPELEGPFSDAYMTGGFACFPMIIGDSVIGIISISNLKKVDKIFRAISSIELLIGVITQIVSVLELPDEESPRSAARQIRAIREFARELESLDDADKMVHRYTETVFRHYNVIAIVMIAENLGIEDRAWIALTTPVTAVEAQEVFDSVASAWRERLPDKQLLSLDRARVIDPDRILPGGGNIYSTSIKIFPIVLDQKMFGIVGVAIADESCFADDHLDLFNLITFQLSVSLKSHFLHRRSFIFEKLDHLTGLYSRKHFDELFAKEFHRCKRYNGHLALLIVDVDHFRDFNDTYGIEEGDVLLSEIGKIIVTNARVSDVLCRIGDDKFGALLPETSLKQAEVQAERIRKFICNYAFYSTKSRLFKKATASLGIASFVDHNPENTEQFMEFADTALYFAKRNGRNRVMSYSFVLNMLLKDSKEKA